MVSDHVHQARSIEELDALLERDRAAAAKVATALTNIGEIHQVANARILADSQVASAKMMTDAEVTAILLSSKAELAVLQIEQQGNGDAADAEARQSMILEVSRNATQAISNSAAQSIEAIQREAKESIDRLRGNASRAIAEIQDLAETIARKVEARAGQAQKTLAREKLSLRSREDVAQNAEDSAAKVHDEASRSSRELRSAAQNIITEAGNAACASPVAGLSTS